MVAGKSLSEYFIFTSTNPQYDNRFFIELQVQYMKIPCSNLGRTCCVQKLFLTFRTIFVQNILSMFCKKKSFWQRFTCTYGWRFLCELDMNPYKGSPRLVWFFYQWVFSRGIVSKSWNWPIKISKSPFFHKYTFLKFKELKRISLINSNF